MASVSDLPSMFYVEPGLDSAKLPIGAEFECVFCPEVMAGDGWVRIVFRVVIAREIRPPFANQRFVQQMSKVALTEAEALALYQGA